MNQLDCCEVQINRRAAAGCGGGVLGGKVWGVRVLVLFVDIHHLPDFVVGKALLFIDMASSEEEHV